MSYKLVASATCGDLVETNEYRNTTRAGVYTSDHAVH